MMSSMAPNELRFSNTLASSAAVLLMLSTLLVGADAQERDAASYLNPLRRAIVRSAGQAILAGERHHDFS